MKHITLYILFFYGLICSAQIKKKVLFIGNSYTYVNNLPQLVKDIALSKSDTLVFDQSVFGGATFQTHHTSPQTYTKIKSQNWDVVVIQGQSQEPSLSISNVMNYSYPNAKKLADSVRIEHPCAEVLYFMTWGRKNSDADNCPTYSPSCSYAGMQGRLRESYLMFADSFNAACAPVGVAWKTFRNNYPLVELYDMDESHPSINGSYLAACVFYSSIFQKAVSGATYYATVDPVTAQNIQTIAGTTVVDSMGVWNLNSYIPTPDFSFSAVNGNTYQFNNLSKNATNYNWSFGSTQFSPQNTFIGSPPYVVTLSVTNQCTLSSITKQVIPAAIEPNELCQPEFIYSQDYLKINTCKHSNLPKINIYDINGKLVLSHTSDNLQEHIDLSELPAGLYIVYGEQAGIVTSKKILRQ